jgi:hypothetical protein
VGGKKKELRGSGLGLAAITAASECAGHGPSLHRGGREGGEFLGFRERQSAPHFVQLKRVLGRPS